MDDNQSLFELEVDYITSEELLDTARWQKMFGVVVLSMIGLVLLVILIAWNKIGNLIDESLAGEGSQAAMALIVVIFLLVAVVLGIMSWFLIRGASRIKSALRMKDQSLFSNGLNDLKTFFIIYGVISIIGLLANLVSLF